MSKFCMAIVLGLISSSVSAQARNNAWVFAQFNRMDIVQGSPQTSSSNTAGANSGSCIADTVGQLVLSANYDGIRGPAGLLIQEMIALVQPHPNCTQQYLIVPHPGIQSHYCVFVNDKPSLARTGLLEVDMSLDGGLGGLVAPDIQWYMDSATARLTAVPHANGQDYWILHHEWMSDEFHAYLLTSAGLDTLPVISATGPTMLGWDVGGQPIHFSGPLVPSAQGDLLVMSANHRHFALPDLPLLDLFAFNDQTGAVTHVTSLPCEDGMVGGIEFSSSGHYLYVQDEFKVGMDYHVRRTQYDVSSGDPFQIVNSAYVLDETTSNAFQGSSNVWMDRASDGKIYFTPGGPSAPWLSVINLPDLAGSACGLQHQSVQCNGDVIGGLPNQMKRYHDSALSTSLPAQQVQVGLSVHPLPLLDHGWISLPPGTGAAEVEWFDALGRTVRKDQTWDGRIDRGELRTGHYVVAIRQGGELLGRVHWPVQ